MQFTVTLLFDDTYDKAGYDLQLSVLEQVKAEFRKDDHITLSGKALQMKPVGRVVRRKTSISETDLVVFDLHIEVELLSATNQ